jgi:hypothetical protein
MGISVLDLSSYTAPVRSWPHRRFNYFRVHNWLGYIALAASLLHPALVLLNKKPVFRIRDILFPVHLPSQPLENTVGADCGKRFTSEFMSRRFRSFSTVC